MQHRSTVKGQGSAIAISAAISTGCDQQCAPATASRTTRRGGADGLLCGGAAWQPRGSMQLRYFGRSTL